MDKLLDNQIQTDGLDSKIVRPDNLVDKRGCLGNKKDSITVGQTIYR